MDWAPFIAIAYIDQESMEYNIIILFNWELFHK